MKLSKYARAYKYNDSYLLFNTLTKSIVKLEDRFFCDKEISNTTPEEYINCLRDMGYLADNDDLVISRIHDALDKDGKLMISVEVGLSCNMRCPYCYQGTEKTNKGLLSDNDIAFLRQYFEKVALRWDFSSIVLKVLGGEPTTMWSVAKKVIVTTRDFCRENSKAFHLMIDTNGVIIQPILELEQYDSLTLTIPLTHKECHDKMRKLVSGHGSYDKIVDNLNILHLSKPDAKLVLRHNTDSENIEKFSDYVHDLKQKLVFQPIIDISYTTELGDETYSNPLKYEDYIHWKSSKAIDILGENDYYIMATPLMSMDKCQFRSCYSLKLFSDGTVGGCAMDFFSSDRFSLKYIFDNLEILEEKNREIQRDFEKCCKCDSFFLCGGGYNLPCIKSLNIEPCAKDGAYIIDTQLFLIKYMHYKKIGKADLFAGFHNNWIIR